MADQARSRRVHEGWAHTRFSVIGHLLAAPPPKGGLASAIAALSQRTWRHPTTGAPTRFGFSTIERWYYRALKEKSDPVALAENHPELNPLPSYATLRRFLKAAGFAKRRSKAARRTEGAERAEARFLDREVRSYEASHVGGLVHWDAHFGSRKVLTPRGEWATPVLFGVLDDRSRLACHLQWYLSETAEVVVHGLCQAFQKRGLPRSSLSDNGAAMTAAEVAEGLTRLGVLQQTTLPYTPEANAKIEILWASVEGRLMAMLEHVSDLSLARLNEATLAWV